MSLLTSATDSPQSSGESSRLIDTKTSPAAAAAPVGGSDSSVFALRNLKITLMFLGLALGCLLLYNVSNPLEFLPTTTNKSQVTKNLDQVLREAAMADNKTVILTALNEAWAEPGSVFDLFLESFRIGNGTKELLNNLVVITLDRKAYKRCMAVHHHCFALTTQGTDFSGEADFMSADYLHMMWRRIEFLRVVLLKGYDFVFTDTDIMWFRNPFPRFLADGDFQIACDYFNGNPADLNNAPNGGFTYVKSSNRTVQFYRFWYETRTSYPGKHDQDVLNQIKSHSFLSDIGLQIRFLDTAFFGGFCQAAKDFDKVCTMHANCCVGLDNKISDLGDLLKDWRKFMVGENRSPSWSVPKACVGSFSKPHKRHRHHWRRLAR